MTPDDLQFISSIFQSSNPESVSRKLSELSREDRKRLSETLFEVQKRVYSTVLEPSIAATYRKIHSNMMRMFFTQIYHINQNLRSDRERWKRELRRLRQIDLFMETSDFDLLSVAENIKQVSLEAYVPFLTQYEEVTGVYLLKDPANVYEFNSKMPVIARAGIFGDDAVATGEKESSVTVKPIFDCKALYIPRDKFERLIRSVPGLQERVFQTVVERAKQGSIRAEEQRKLTQEILDNIGQGSFSINVAGEIGENYTKIAAKYLGAENLAGVPFADLAFRNDREKLRNYYRALHMMFSGTDFNHTVVLDLLPNEVQINERDYQLHYSFVQDGAGHVMSVFVRMEDITLRNELARKEARENAINSKMQANVGGFMDMLEDVTNTFQAVEQFANDYLETGSEPENNLYSEMMRMLHGSKGLSGQFELTRLKEVVHQFEDWFLRAEKKGIEDNKESFRELFTKFQRELEYATSFKENLGEGIIEILNGVSFSNTQFDALERAAKQGDIKTIRSIIFSKNLLPAHRIVSNWEKDALRLAERLDKQVSLAFNIEEDLGIPKEMAKKLNINLGHLYRNCIDHGIELPEQRVEAGKDPIGKVEITIAQQQDLMFIAISDDGKGIDFDKISQIARENPNLNQEEVSDLIEKNDPGQLLFLPGFSSAEQVTDISGRGVGMDAVKTTVSDLGGNIELNSTLGSGTEFIVTIPLRKVSEEDS